MLFIRSYGQIHQLKGNDFQSNNSRQILICLSLMLNNSFELWNFYINFKFDGYTSPIGDLVQQRI